MTFIKKFESIKKKMAGFDASAIGEKIAMQVNMVDEDCGGAFYVEAENGILSIEPYDYNDRTVMLTLKAADIVALADKKAALSDLVEKGEVTVEGNFGHAEAIFELKKPAVKKTAKAPAKKEAKAEEKTAKAPAKKEAKTEEKKTKAPAKKEAKAEEKKTKTAK